jgi:LysM repeat protein
MKLKLFFLLFLCLLLAPVAPVRAQSQAPSAEDVLAAVNALRSSNHLPALQSNAALVLSAQRQSDYQASIHMFTHTDAKGTNVTDRALAAGYGSGGTIQCGESIAVANIATSMDYILSHVWQGSADRAVLLNKAYQDVGTGVTTKGSQVYYTFVACATTGSAAGNQTPRATTGAGTPVSATITPTSPLQVNTTTPKADGSIIHLVETGQTLWSISIAYGVTVDQLIALNNLDTKNPVIYAGQKLVVRAAFTPTTSPTLTETPRPPTITPRPTATRRPTRPPHTATALASPTADPAAVRTGGLTRQSVGLGILAVSAVGLLILLATSVLRKKK